MCVLESVYLLNLVGFKSLASSHLMPYLSCFGFSQENVCAKLVTMAASAKTSVPMADLETAVVRGAIVPRVPNVTT